MKLKALRIEPAGTTGWSSGELVFGGQITELFGPNGCGKTPVIQSIAYVLGYPVKFRDDVVSHCSAAVLTLSTDNGELELRRKIGSQFDVEARQEGQQVKTFYTEKDYTKFLFELFGFEMPTLTSTGNEPVTPYMVTLLPLFYLDQDHGYSTAYKAPNTFIKDQYTEMVRLVFALTPKHSYDQKKLVIEKKRRLDHVDRLIVKKQEFIEILSNDLGGSRRPLQDIDADIAEVREGLERLKVSRSLKSDAHSAIDSLLYEKQSVHHSLLNEINELQVRMAGFARIQNEIEIEVNTLSLNEEARRLFSSFEDICSNPACGLFLGSSDSYGKNLLYLKDQIKDLQRNTTFQQARIDELNKNIATMVDETAALETKRDELAAGDEVGGLVEAIGQLTRRLFDLQSEKHSIEELDENERAYVEHLNERESLQNDLASFSGSASQSDLRAIEIRSKWRDRIVYWLDILKTRNVSREVSIDADFDLRFGGENIGQFHGSTLLRVVLAIHTAIFELYTKDPSKKFRFLILDTPRQQDIERDVLSNYIAELKKLAVSRLAQIVFSTTDYHYPCVGGDREWTPTFPGAEQKMFLGVVEKEAPDKTS